MPRGSRGFKLSAGNTAPASDVINFPHTEQWGVESRTRLEAVIGEASPGVAVSQGPTEVYVREQPALAIAQVDLGLVSSQWVNVATESAGSDWNDLANSQGQPDGAYATLTEGLVLTQGTLIGDFPDFVNKSSLTIDKVELTFHYRVAEFLLAGSSLLLQYRIGALGLPTTLRTITGGVITPTNENNLVTGRTFDVTADRAWTWTDLNDLQCLHNGTILIDAGLSAVQAEATRLRVTASLTY